jgi:uncharacterized protein YndB with AHSA1/START domain
MIEPVVKEIWVGAGVHDAFRRFTAEFAAWWPTGTHSASRQECKEVHLEGRVGGHIFEEASDGALHRWGSVSVWEPPRRVAFTWHPGRDPDTAQTVEVEFSPLSGGTQVRLTHSGWERLGDGALDMRGEYDTGWQFVLSRYSGVFQ